MLLRALPRLIRRAMSTIADNTALTSITLASPADFHVHLRQGDLMNLVVPHVKQGGIKLAYVMVSLALRLWQEI